MKIHLKNIAIRANHGVYDFEKTEGNDFKVNISFEANLSLSATTDQLSHTINYEEIYAIVKQEMSHTADLLESVVERIYQHILQKFPQISWIKVSVEKPNPFRDGNVEAVAVEKEGFHKAEN